MHALSIIHGVEAVALAGAGIGCLRVGKWKLAFSPLVCAAMVGAVLAAGY
ncbi:hypothetical protein ACAX43_26615 [Paraburkholderia sp. IW21]